jgi:hypothetical protein
MTPIPFDSRALTGCAEAPEAQKQMQEAKKNAGRPWHGKQAARREETPYLM